MEYFEKNIFSDRIQLKVEKIEDTYKLRDIVNLHNDDGIKEIQQVKKMIRQIDSGNDIFPAFYLLV